MTAITRPGGRKAAQPADRTAEDGVRLARKRAMIDEALADVAAGRVIHDHAVDEWLDRFLSGEPLFIPAVGPRISGKP
jgi:hypothetical protein